LTKKRVSYPSKSINNKQPVEQQNLAIKMEVTPGIEPGIRALQALALPLGYVTSYNVPYELGLR
jgi:hypothetical protein